MGIGKSYISEFSSLPHKELVVKYFLLVPTMCLSSPQSRNTWDIKIPSHLTSFTNKIVNSSKKRLFSTLFYIWARA
jgi:hypothetical protein